MIQKIQPTHSKSLDSQKTSEFSHSEERMRNDRQTIFSLTREIVRAQFELADQELCNRIWQDIAKRGIEIERIINLMYGCSFHDDDHAMLEVDLAYEREYQ